MIKSQKCFMQTCRWSPIYSYKKMSLAAVEFDRRE